MRPTPKRRLSRPPSSSDSPPASPTRFTPPGSPKGIEASLLHNHGTSTSTATATQSASATTASRNMNMNATASSYRLGRRPDEKRDARPAGLMLPPQPYMPMGIQKDRPPTLFGVELKWISLATLALQNAFLTIIMHYSRISTPPSRTYSAATAVLLAELLKVFISSFIALRKIDRTLGEQERSHARLSDGHGHTRSSSKSFTLFTRSRLEGLRRSVLSPDCYKLAIPAILYVVQNNLLYVASSNLDVATYQVTNQMKIVTTAFFSVMMLGKRLSRTQWGALVLLAIGVGIVQLQAVGTDPLATMATLVENRMQPVRGFVAVTLACVTSGVAGVYFELIVKSPSGSGGDDLWTRNTQLSLFSIVPALIPVLVPPQDAHVSYFSTVASRFAHFGGWAPITTVIMQALGGVVTSVVIKYSDNILKGFATSLSILISFLASVILFNNYTLTAAFVLGASIVLAATYAYNTYGLKPAQRTGVAVAPDSPIPSSSVILGEKRAPSRAAAIVSLLTRRPSGSAEPSGYYDGGSHFMPPPYPLSRPSGSAAAAFEQR